jgi:hypothetical protein
MPAERLKRLGNIARVVSVNVTVHETQYQDITRWVVVGRLIFLRYK